MQDQIYPQPVKTLKMTASLRHFLYICFLTGALYGGRSQPQTSSTPSHAGFVTIFDGKTLDNWKGDTTYWRVEGGSLIGEVTPETILKRNTFIIWQGGKPANFELKLDYKISARGNSGINYRSVTLDTIPFALRGYQADIDGANRYTGQNYEERGRTTLAYRGQKVIVHTQEHPETEGSLQANVKSNAWQHTEVITSIGDRDSLTRYIKNDDWNECHIVANGNRILHYVNGMLMSDVTDDDAVNRTMAGWIGVQVHTGPPMKVEFRNIRLKEIR